jgi:hypothetical protein
LLLPANEASAAISTGKLGNRLTKLIVGLNMSSPGGEEEITMIKKRYNKRYNKK